MTNDMTNLYYMTNSTTNTSEQHTTNRPTRTRGSMVQRSLNRYCVRCI